MRVEWGSLVSLDYEILLDSGEQVDSSRAYGPLRLRVGEWTALPGLGQRLVGLQPGDERLIRLAPREAFGDWDVNAVRMMRESGLVEGEPLEDGTTLQVETEDGASALCRAYRVSEDRLALDFNHPLAGQALTIFVRVNEVNLPVERGRPSSRCPDAERHGGGRSPRRRGASSEEAVAVARQRRSILIVDDDAEMRALLLDVLRNDGYDVVEAKDGTEAVLALRSRPFDLILMDKNMPGPSGLDLLPGFRRVCPDSPVILMTAFGDVPSYMEAVEKGAAEYLFKPFRMEELRVAIAKALHGDAQPRP